MGHIRTLNYDGAVGASLAIGDRVGLGNRIFGSIKCIPQDGDGRAAPPAGAEHRGLEGVIISKNGNKVTRIIQEGVINYA